MIAGGLSKSAVILGRARLCSGCKRLAQYAQCISAPPVLAFTASEAMQRRWVRLWAEPDSSVQSAQSCQQTIAVSLAKAPRFEPKDFASTPASKAVLSLHMPTERGDSVPRTKLTLSELEPRFCLHSSIADKLRGNHHGLGQSPSRCQFAMQLSLEGTTALDVLNNLRFEFPHRRICITRGYAGSTISDAELDRISLARMLRQSFVVWIEDEPHLFDHSELLHALHTVREEIEELRILKSKAEESLQVVDLHVDRRLNLIVYGGGTVLSAQLVSIVVLTYELGWDLMEPVTCLIGLGNMVLGSAYYAFLRRDYTHEHAGTHLASLLYSSICRKAKISPYALLSEIQGANYAEKVWQPVVTSFLLKARPEAISWRVKQLSSEKS